LTKSKEVTLDFSDYEPNDEPLLQIIQPPAHWLNIPARLKQANRNRQLKSEENRKKKFEEKARKEESVLHQHMPMAEKHEMKSAKKHPLPTVKISGKEYFVVGESLVKKKRHLPKLRLPGFSKKKWAAVIIIVLIVLWLLW